MLTTWLAVSATLLAGPGPLSGADSCVVAPPGRPVPSSFVANRWFVRWPLRVGGELVLLLDTGGPRGYLLSGAVRRLGLVPDVRVMGSDTVAFVRLPREIAAQLAPSIPSFDYQDTASVVDSGSVRLMATLPGGRTEAVFASLAPAGLAMDGIRGPDWFAERAWTFDYPGRRLLLHEAEATGSLPARCWVPLGFQVDSAGNHTTNFPRITAVIDGDSVDFLFDLGATAALTDSAWRMVEPELEQVRGASFVVHERFERWHARHPDWPVIERGEQHGFGSGRLIRVPAIEVGGRRFGPVWFSERPDAAFRGLSQWMDRDIEGALGGSAWRYVTVVLDYPRERAAILPATR